MSPITPEPATPRLALGMLFEVCEGGFYWHTDAGDLRAPIGTRGMVMPWSRGCAVRFEGLSHPTHDVFPMSLEIPGTSPVPRWMRVTGMQKERKP